MIYIFQNKYMMHILIEPDAMGERDAARHTEYQHHDE